MSDDIYTQLSRLKLSDGSSAATRLTPKTIPTTTHVKKGGSFPSTHDRGSKNWTKPHTSSEELNVMEALRSAGVNFSASPSSPSQATTEANILDLFQKRESTSHKDPTTSNRESTSPSNLTSNSKNFVASSVLGPPTIDNFEATLPIIRTLPELKGDGRYIVVGDVHGCVDQLRSLVHKVKFRQGVDLLIIIGDFVNKGPDSIGVVRYCQSLGAIGVLGNHDFTLLKCISVHRRKPFAEDRINKDPVKKLAVEFPPECEAYLRSLPHILKLPKYNLILVHAGLNFQFPLERQNVMEVMHMRRMEEITTVDSHTGRPKKVFNAVSKGDGELWARLWEGPEHVIFGHDASTGFQSHPFATGIDTGCVYGDPLTCVIYDDDKKEGNFVSVSGLPKFSNEKLGLPPPDSDVYEEFDNLDKRIYLPTPTPRTPSVVGGGAPVFLSSPPALTSSSHDPHRSQASPVGASPPLPSSPPVPSMDLSVAQLTLLSLSEAHEISAIAKLCDLPPYEEEVDKISSSPDSVRKFWTLFANNVLSYIITSKAEKDELKAEEEVLNYIFSACGESEELLKKVMPSIRSLRCSGSGQKAWSKGTVKYLTILLEE